MCTGTGTKPRGNDWALLCLPLVTCIAVRKWEQAGAKAWDAFRCFQNQQRFCPCFCKTAYNVLRQIRLEPYDIANVKINGDWSTFGKETLSRLDVSVVLPSVGSPRSCCQENRGLCACPACALQPSHDSRITVLYRKILKWKTPVFYFSLLCCYHCSFTCLINYAPSALLKLSGFGVLCFPKVFFFLYCFRWLWMVRDSECYLWGFDLLPYSLKSSQFIYAFLFCSEPHFPHKRSSLTWFWKSFLKKIYLVYRLQCFFRREKPIQPNWSFLHNFSPFTISNSIRTLLHSGVKIYFPEF